MGECEKFEELCNLFKTLVLSRDCQNGIDGLQEFTPINLKFISQLKIFL